MGDPKVLPIGEVPNWAQLRFGLAESELDLRILRDRLDCEHVGVGYMRFGAGWLLTVGHRHPPGGEEVYVLVEGRARIKIGEQIHSMAAPSAIRVGSEEFRAIRAVGDTSALFIVVGYPIEDPDETEFAAEFWPEDE
jgi:mannose-6-phosphate isomerase-like protein (cupin superfamily)